MKQEREEKNDNSISIICFAAHWKHCLQLRKCIYCLSSVHEKHWTQEHMHIEQTLFLGARTLCMITITQSDGLKSHISILYLRACHLTTSLLKAVLASLLIQLCVQSKVQFYEQFYCFISCINRPNIPYMYSILMLYSVTYLSGSLSTLHLIRFRRNFNIHESYRQ